MVNPKDMFAVLLVTLLAIAILSSGLGAQHSAGGGNVTTDVAIVDGSQQFGSRVEEVNTVNTSLRDAVALTGAPDSNVTIESDADLGHDFSVCTWGELDSSVVTNNEDGLLLATQSAVLWYNGTDDVYRGYYYNTSSRNSFRANVTATSPSTDTLVCLNHANQSLNVSANTTTGTAVATGSSNIADYPENVSNWDGLVEETRLYAEPLNGSQRTEWVAEPVLAVQGPAPATRVTYDEFDSPSSPYRVYFAAGEATASNATVVTGYDGPDIVAGTDYRIAGNDVEILAGGALNETGEVLYLSFDQTELGTGLATRLGQLALALVGLIGIALLIDRRL